MFLENRFLVREFNELRAKYDPKNIVGEVRNFLLDSCLQFSCLSSLPHHCCKQDASDHTVGRKTLLASPYDCETHQDNRTICEGC
jgi:hypothetical protein